VKPVIPYHENVALKWEHGRLVIEMQAKVRIPIAFEMMTQKEALEKIRLTKREKQILKWLLQGMANKEIANKAGISERTVKFHVSALLLKFRVPGRGGLQALFAGENSEAENLVNEIGKLKIVKAG
jgi:DNA-binding CsgD family transcriptional regulator